MTASAALDAGLSRPHPARAVRAARPSGGRAILVLFFLALIPPSYFFIGGLRLDLMRLLLILVFIPLSVQLLTGAAGRVRAMDIWMLLFCAWVVFTYVYHHGTERFPYAMITMVEFLGSYLIGRVLVRSPTDFRRLFLLALGVMIFLVPFVVVELRTGRNLLQEISSQFLPTLRTGANPRSGLFRVAAGFEHPILYGLFCSATLAVLLAMTRGHKLRRLLLGGFVTFMTFASLSSAPLLALAIQIGLLVWGRITGERWALLLGLVFLAYVGIVITGRSPSKVVINRFTFDAQTGYMRLLIWEYGSAEMGRHPLFGIGLNDWTRPAWMPPSVDNFWLVIGMRHGAFGLLLLLLALGSGLWRIVRAPIAEAEVQNLRTAYLITVAALGFTLTTVHVWGGASCFVFLLFGAGQWFGDRPAPVVVASVSQRERMGALAAGTGSSGRWMESRAGGEATGGGPAELLPRPSEASGVARRQPSMGPDDQVGRQAGEAGASRGMPYSRFAIHRGRGGER